MRVCLEDSLKYSQNLLSGGWSPDLLIRITINLLDFRGAWARRRSPSLMHPCPDAVLHLGIYMRLPLEYGRRR